MPPNGTQNNQEDLESRIADLEATVSTLQEQIASMTGDLNLLAAAVDVDPVDPTCPNCNEGELRQESGLSWSRAVCENCEASWYL